VLISGTDSKIRFSLEPLSNNGGVEQWKRSMRAIIRIPGGIPSLIRIKLWSTLADLHIRLAGFKWEQIRRNTLSEKIQPDDNKIHSQILKDLNRTGWSEFDDEKKLKQVMIFLIECVLPRGYFDQSLGALSVDLIVMRDLMLQRLPAIIHHLEQLQSNEYEPPLINLFSMHWFLTLFTTCLPRNCVMRVWDALMLNGSEILIRTAIALWSKISSSRKILHTSSADEFYTLMKNLCKDLMEMNEQEQDHLMKVIYSMAEFPYPGLTELREKHTWNIQPLSTTIKSFRKSVNNVLYDDPSDEEATCIPCSRKRDLTTWNDLRQLQKQYQLKQQQQKHAAVVLTFAYHNSQNALSNVSKLTSLTYPLSFSPPVFNHLLLGPILARDESKSELPTAISGGVAQLAATIVQPSDIASRMTEDVAMNKNSSIDFVTIQD
ncbi:hypothetical protein Angca_003409, partial [Angiostrongylus cantonensis]